MNKMIQRRINTLSINIYSTRLNTILHRHRNLIISHHSQPLRTPPPTSQRTNLSLHQLPHRTHRIHQHRRQPIRTQQQRLRIRNTHSQILRIRRHTRLPTSHLTIFRNRIPTQYVSMSTRRTQPTAQSRLSTRRLRTRYTRRQFSSLVRILSLRPPTTTPMTPKARAPGVRGTPHKDLFNYQAQTPSTRELMTKTKFRPTAFKL